MSIRRCPGLLAVERDHAQAFLRWSPPATWVPFGARIDDWKSQLHVVDKSLLSADVRDALALRTPEDRIPASRRLDSAMARSTRLAVVPDDLRDALIAAGVRVWTVGYHRVPAWFRLVGVGGPGEPAWIEQQGPDDLDRILRAASDRVLDEASVLLAAFLDRQRWGNLHLPYDERRSAFDEDMRWAPDWQRRWRDDEDDHRTPALESAVADLAAGRPDVIEVDGIGTFRREWLPETAFSPQAEAIDGWLPPVVHPRVPLGRLQLAPVLRYVRPMTPGPWWEI